MKTTTPTSMSDVEFDRLRTIIYERSGIWFADGKKYVIESRLGRRLEELEIESFAQYAQFLTMGPYQREEFQEMFNRITINETSFFRNEPQLDIFERHVLTDMLEKRKSTKRLRIWSAACSTGEEPYTLAMILQRTLGVRLSDWRIEILGTDISERVLKVAQTGLYGQYALRTTSDLVKQRFFKPENDLWRIDPSVQAMVNFEVHNLKDSLAIKRHGTWDIIFCRNVMIYFDDEMKTRCSQMFNSVLADDGAMLIGHSETLNESDGWERTPEVQAFAYAKRSRNGL